MAKLTFAKRLDELERRIGLRVADRARLERAMTHSSHASARKSASYERLEFLGDRVLGLVVAEKLFELFPKANEGELSVKLNSLVSAEACAGIADELGLSEFIRHGGEVTRLSPENTRNIRADVVESLIAAIYLANGLEDARRFILATWGERMTNASASRRDPKTQLQEWVHKKSHKPPRYEVVERTGPDHDPTFTVQTVIEGLRPGEGRGRSRRLAEQEAAMVVLKREGLWKETDA